MKKHLILILTVIYILTLLPPMGTAGAIEKDYKTFYVSAKGDDRNDGTQGNPFLTLERARAEVRKYNKNMQGDIVVNVESGIYIMTDALTLTGADSGTNGHRVIWRGDGEDTVISGGRLVTGFTQHDGDIYKAMLSSEYGDKKISVLSVNGKLATWSHTRNLMKSETVKTVRYKDVSGTALNVREDATEILNLKKPSEAYFQYAWSWRNATSPVRALVTDESDGSKWLQLGSVGGNVISSMPTPSFLYSYYLWNDYSLMTEPGDFYYEGSTRTLYYKKPSDVDMDTATVIAPFLEKVLFIEGKDVNNKVENVVMEGFIFAHTDDFAARYGYTNDQSNLFRYFGKQDSPWDGMQTASVWVKNANNLTIQNNCFSQSGKYGIGFYEGVTNSTLDGNVFKDLLSGGIQVGLPCHNRYFDEEVGMTNVAFMKETTASNDPEGVFSKAAVNNYVDAVPLIESDSSGNTWLQVYLGDYYTVDKLQFENFHEARPVSTFEIWGSDVDNFLEYEILAKSTKDINPFTFGELWEVDLKPKQPFRYIRFVSTGSSAVYVDKLRVYTNQLGGMPSTEICSNNKITNNVLNDINGYYKTACAIQYFHGTDSQINHNEIYGASYSGISSGWNWSHTAVTTQNNNQINYNYIVGGNQQGYDSGGIYCLGGRLETEEVKGNYIKDMRNPYGGIYLDNGTINGDIFITQNVVENCPYGLFIPGDDRKAFCDDNYVTNHNRFESDANCYARNTKFFVKGFMPDEAQKIADFAGLEAGYERLRAKAGIERDTMKFYDNYPTADDIGLYSYGMVPDMGVAGDYMAEADIILKIIYESGLITYENRNSVKAFERIVRAAKGLEADEEYSIPENLSQEEKIKWSFDITAKFRGELDEFINSGIFTKDNYIMPVENIEVIGVSGKGVDAAQHGKDGLPEFASEVELFTDNTFSTDEIYHNIETIKGYQTNATAEDGYIRFTNSGGGYTSYKFADTVIETKVKTGEEISYNGFVLRASRSSSDSWLSAADVYLICFKHTFVEIQRWNSGKRVVYETMPIGLYKHNAVNDVKLQAKNESGGVRIIVEINGDKAVNYLDSGEGAVREAGLFGFLAPSGIELYPFKQEIYDDLENYEWAKDSINNAYLAKYIIGKEERVFAPSDPVTRAELTAILTRLLKIEPLDRKSLFFDVNGDEWFASAISRLEFLGVFNGVVGEEFMPNLPLKRIEVAEILSNYLSKRGYFVQDYDVSGITYADLQNHTDSVNLCAILGIMKGTDENTFNPDSNVSRAETAKIIMRLKELLG